MKNDERWLADIARYPQRPFLKEQSIWAVWLYRYGNRLDREEGIARSWKLKIYFVLFRFVETATGISIPKECIIGGGLRIYHFGGIFFHPKCRLGEGCTIRQGVTIGNRGVNDEAPQLGNNVDIGAYAQILGNIHIGDNVKIGAAAVVVRDAADGAVLVGNPARQINQVTRL